jgi:hypothetical protein
LAGTKESPDYHTSRSRIADSLLLYGGGFCWGAAFSAVLKAFLEAASTLRSTRAAAMFVCDFAQPQFAIRSSRQTRISNRESA